MMTLLLTLSWLSILAVVYHHALYPLLLQLLASRRASRRHAPPLADPPDWPEIGVLIPCYNEAEVIAHKLYNLASCDYPAQALKVYVVCDGCQDDTAAKAREAANSWICEELQIEVIEHADNRGKLAVIVDSVSRMREDLLVLTDASALISIDALRILARRLQNPDIGGVSARYQLLAAGGSGQQAYWNYQVRIKQLEDATGSTLGAHGACYALRRSLFVAPPADTINDDFVIPMNLIRQGFQMRYEPDIVALELEHMPEREELRRRRRIAIGNVQMSLQLADLLHPRYGWVALHLFSGKMLRAWMPLWLLIALLGSAASALHYPWMGWIVAAQLAGYLLALWQQLWPRWPNLRVMQLLHYVVAGHLAGARGLVDYFFRHGRVSWA